MREIKFRAWDESEKQMVEWPHLKNDPDGYLIGLLSGESPEDRLMQFTGLHDKNGTEIYEGDIVGEENVYHFISREGWEPSKGQWKIIGEKTKKFASTLYGEEEKYIAGYELQLVRWEDKSCGFEPFSDSKGNCGHCGGGINPKEVEIIGNIYQSPELLK